MALNGEVLPDKSCLLFIAWLLILPVINFALKVKSIGEVLAWPHLRSFHAWPRDSGASAAPPVLS